MIKWLKFVFVGRKIRSCVETESQSSFPTANLPDQYNSEFYDIQTQLLIVLSWFTSRILEFYIIL